MMAMASVGAWSCLKVPELRSQQRRATNLLTFQTSQTSFGININDVIDNALDCNGAGKDFGSVDFTAFLDPANTSVFPQCLFGIPVVTQNFSVVLFESCLSEQRLRCARGKFGFTANIYPRHAYFHCIFLLLSKSNALTGGARRLI
jgi:hypothetical protein